MAIAVQNNITLETVKAANTYFFSPEMMKEMGSQKIDIMTVQGFPCLIVHRMAEGTNLSACYKINPNNFKLDFWYHRDLLSRVK